MAKRFKEKKLYPFEWIDEIVEQKLNRACGNPECISPKELEALNVRFMDETKRALFLLKKKTFHLFCPKKINIIVTQYDNALQLLRSQARLNLDNCPEDGQLRDTCKSVADQLDALWMYLQKRYPVYLPAKKSRPVNLSVSSGGSLYYKILCKLSVDQLGLILKAADDAKLIVSRSLSLIFKTIVPHLSTDHKKELSWDSMRSNSYHPEQADKELAIQALEKMIQQIREYR